MLIIFIAHSGLFFNFAELGVCIFLVMSGFLMMYNYSNDSILNNTLNDNIRFATSRISKLYKLHIYTMCISIICVVLEIGEYLKRTDIVSLGASTVLNVTLLQTWIPYNSINQPLNGVAWYLSVIFFIYFVFSWLKDKICNNTCGSLAFFLFIFATIEVLATYVLLLNTSQEASIYVWLRYYFPIFRIFDFLAGSLIYKITIQSTIKEFRVGYFIGSIIFTVLIFVVKGMEVHNVFLINLQNSTIPVVASACIWILLYYLFDGCLPKIVDNKFFRYLGNISGEFFLIHYVVIKMLKLIVKSPLLQHKLMCSKFFLFFLELMLSILFTELYINNSKRVKT